MSPLCSMGPYRKRYHLLASSVMTPDPQSRSCAHSYKLPYLYGINCVHYGMIRTLIL